MHLDAAARCDTMEVTDGARGNAPSAFVCTVLAPPFADRLASACPSHGLVDLRDRGHERARDRAELLCVDPLLLGHDVQRRAEVAALTSRGIPCVFYTGTSAAALQAVAAFQSVVAPVRLVLHGVDDSPQALASLVPFAARARYGMELCAAMREVLMLLPAVGVREAMQLVLSQPQRFFDGTDVARSARISRRHLDRLLVASGLAPAKDWVIAARAFHAARMLASGARTVSGVADLLGYADEKALRRHTDAVWGLTPREAAEQEPDTLLGQVVRFVGAESGQMADAAP